MFFSDIFGCSRTFNLSVLKIRSEIYLPMREKVPLTGNQINKKFEYKKRADYN